MSGLDDELKRLLRKDIGLWTAETDRGCRALMRLGASWKALVLEMLEEA